MLKLDSQTINLIILLLCLIICFRTKSVFACGIIVGILVSNYYNRLLLSGNLYKKPKTIISSVSLNDTPVSSPTGTNSDPLLDKINEIKSTFTNKEHNTEPEIKKPCTKNCSEINVDGDEFIAYSNTHRNEPTRVINGMQNAYKNLEKYVREEVDDTEKRIWWGNADY